MDRSKFNLTNKYCLITGSGGLLGKEHAAALLEIKSKDLREERISQQVLCKLMY